ncbi:MAG: hypothetical protein ACLURP_04895 [Ruminococcus sp.]
MLLETCREPVEMLVELTREFIRMYGEKKREKIFWTLRTWSILRWKF